MNEKPDLCHRLFDGISELPCINNETLERFTNDLYEAYLFMREYVESDSCLGIPNNL